jgi:hypothetical protein
VPQHKACEAQQQQQQQQCALLLLAQQLFLHTFAVGLLLLRSAQPSHQQGDQRAQQGHASHLARRHVPAAAQDGNGGCV